MTNSPDADWDELGVTWRAIDPDLGIISSRLQKRLRRQSEWLAAALVIGVPLCAGGVLFGLVTLAFGFTGVWNLITRGIGIMAISAIVGSALWSLQGVRVGTSGALSEMIDLAIARAQKIRSLIRAGLYACVVAAVFGLAGTAIRTHFGRAPRMSPIIDLAMLGLVALALFLYGRQQRAELAKYRALSRALAGHAEA